MMPAYNAERFLREAIDSVLAQTYPNWELIVVDDGSTDQTSRIAEACGDTRVRLLRQDHRGQAASRNVALDHSGGEYVGFLDADDVLLPNHLEATVDHLASHPEHAGVYTDGFYVTPDGQRLKKLSARRRGPFSGRIFAEVVRGSDAVGPPLCVVLRREPIRAHALSFDETIAIGPDWDFFLRFAAIGDFGYVDDCTCLYRVHDSNVTLRTGLEQRMLEFAKCRTKAIKLAAFGSCPPDVRLNAFHDLLVNGLRHAPQRQREVLGWDEFLALRPRDRARLLRLMASVAILSGGEPATVREWLRRSREADATDLRAIGVSLLYALSPGSCARLLRLRRKGQADPAATAPFGDLDVASP